jgi:hypothetical protein
VRGTVVWAGPRYAFAEFEGLGNVLVPYTSFDEWVDRLDRGAAIEALLGPGRRPGEKVAKSARIATALESPGAAPTPTVRAIGDPDPNDWREGTVVRTGARRFVLAEIEGLDELALVHFEAFTDWIEQLHVGDRLRARVERGNQGQLRALEAELL